MITGGFIISALLGGIRIFPISSAGLYALLSLAGVLALFLLVIVIICLCERQYLSGEVEPATPPYPYTPSPYWQETREAAFQLGLQHAGDFATKKNTSLVKGLLSLFITQDRQVIASIVSGSTAGAKLKKTVLRSRLANGRVLESSDIAGLEDFSGVMDRAILLNAGMEELLGFHVQRLVNSGSSALPFNPDAVLEEYERMDLDRGARWVLLGMARWVDPQQTSIRMTFRGALAHLKRMFHQMSKLNEQQQRSHIRRAGSRR